MTGGDPGPDFGERQNFPFMIGMYLAANAIADAYLLVDGPDCAHMKTQYVQGNHDLLSTLTDISGLHRVTNTALHPFQMAAAREQPLSELLARMSGHPRVGLVLVTSMPMASITGVDYDRLAAQVSAAGGAQVLHVPGRSLSGDWLSAYGLTLEALASELVLGEPEAAPGQVAIVGHLMDRTEADQTASIDEIRRLLSRIGLEVCSIWLSGGRVGELREARRASLVVSLPYGRRAARTLGKRLGRPVLETGLPLGLDGTVRWLRAIAEATDRAERAEDLIDAELARVAGRLQSVVPHVFLHRTVAIVGDPHLLEALVGLATELGCRIGPLVCTAREGHAPGLEAAIGGVPIAFEPTRGELMSILHEQVQAERVDLVISNSAAAGLMASQTPVVELGYPSYFTHALYDAPFLGFDGVLALVDRMANALRRIDLVRMKGGGPGPGSSRPHEAQGSAR